MNECMFECYRRLFNLLHLVLAALILGIFVTGMYAIRKFHKILELRVLSLSTTTVCTGYTSATTASTTTTIATLTIIINPPSGMNIMATFCHLLWGRKQTALSQLVPTTGKIKNNWTQIPMDDVHDDPFTVCLNGSVCVCEFVCLFVYRSMEPLLWNISC